MANVAGSVPGTRAQGVPGDRPIQLWGPTPNLGASRLGLDPELAALVNPLLARPDPVQEARRDQSAKLDAVDAALDTLGKQWWTVFDAAFTAHAARAEAARKNPDLSADGLQRQIAASVSTFVTDLKAGLDTWNKAAGALEAKYPAKTSLDAWPDEAVLNAMHTAMMLSPGDFIARWKAMVADPAVDEAVLTGMVLFGRSIQSDARYAAVSRTVGKLLDDSTARLLTSETVAAKYLAARLADIRIGVGTAVRETISHSGFLPPEWRNTIQVYFAAPADRLVLVNTDAPEQFERDRAGNVIVSGDLGEGPGPTAVMG